MELQKKAIKLNLSFQISENKNQSVLKKSILEKNSDLNHLKENVSIHSSQSSMKHLDETKLSNIKDGFDGYNKT